MVYNKDKKVFDVEMFDLKKIVDFCKILLSSIVISILITFFCMQEIKAYYQKQVDEVVNINTVSMFDINLFLDKLYYGSTEDIKLTVNNQNKYDVKYTIVISNKAYTVDGQEVSNYTVNSLTSNINTINFSDATGKLIEVTVKTTEPYETERKINIYFDNELPEASITSTNNLSETQTVTLTMSDDNAVTSYYWGKKENPTESEFTTIEATASTTIAKTVSESGKYYLIVKDTAGNEEKKEIIYSMVSFEDITQKKLVEVGKAYGTLPTYNNQGYDFEKWYVGYSTSIDLTSSNWKYTDYSSRTQGSLTTDTLSNGLIGNVYRVDAKNTSSIDTLTSLISNKIDIEPNRQYAVGFYAKTNNSQGISFKSGTSGWYSNVQWNDSSTYYAFTNSEQKINGDNEWHYLELIITSPSNASKMTINIRTESPDLYGVDAYFEIADVIIYDKISGKEVKDILATTIVTNESDHMILAKKTGKKFIVTFNPNGGTVSETTREVTYNSSYGTMPIPTKEGYKFLG